MFIKTYASRRRFKSYTKINPDRRVVPLQGLTTPFESPRDTLYNAYSPLVWLCKWVCSARSTRSSPSNRGEWSILRTSCSIWCPGASLWWICPLSYGKNLRQRKNTKGENDMATSARACTDIVVCYAWRVKGWGWVQRYERKTWRNNLTRGKVKKHKLLLLPLKN